MKLKDAKTGIADKVDALLKELNLDPESEFDGRITVEMTGTVHPVKVEIKLGPVVTAVVDSIESSHALLTASYTRDFSSAFADNADRKHADHMLALVDPERFTRWHDGPPPSLGWWPTQLRGKKSNALRWWDGKQWSFPVWPSDPPYIVSVTSETPAWDEVQPQIQWRHRPTSWPVESFT